MTIQKKSLISKLNTTKKAIVASSTPENPSVSAPVSARVKSYVRSTARVKAYVRASARVKAAVRPKV